MKEVRVQVPDNQVEVIEDLIETFELSTSEMILKNGDSLFFIRIQDNQTNNLLHELKARGVGDVFGEISIIPLDLHVPSTYTKSSIDKSPSANLEEILANIEDSAVLSGSYVALVVLSGALAAFGLIRDSIIIIIGSMIVAPLLGPVALTSIGFLLPERGILRKGVMSELVGILLTVLVGFLIGIVINFYVPIEINDQMRERAQGADPYNVAFAIVSGLAAGVIISRGQSLSIVGVAIAASLAPPAANIGIYLAIQNPEGAGIATALLLMNILAINASCSIMFQLFRLPEKAGISKRRATKVQRTNFVIAILTLIGFIMLTIFLLNAINLENS